MLPALLLLVTVAPDETVVFSKPETGIELKMDLYKPQGAPAGKPTAAVVVIHGGAWVGGNKEQMTALADAISKQGMFAASIQYRLAPKSIWPAFYDDAQTAVRYLRANASKLNIEPKRIGATGASAGGHMALLLGFTDTRNSKAAEFAGQSSKVGAVFNIFGPTDMSRDYPPTIDILFQTVLGKKRVEAAAEIKAASPVSHIDKTDAPVFTLHGTADQLVPVAQSRWLDEKLKAAGVHSELVIIEGMPHALPVEKPEVLKAVERGIAFLKDRLK